MIKLFVGVAGAALCASALAGEVSVRAAKPQLVSEGDVHMQVGRVEGSHTVQVSARVVGTLWERHGEEGQVVRKGDVLYRIEDTIYKANLAVARAKQSELEARLRLAEVEAERYSAGEAKGGVSKSDRDRIIVNRDVVRAELEAARAQTALCENDLSYCTITSPIDGRLGRYRFDTGNNVGPESGALRDIIAFDPIDIVVAVPEPVVIWGFDHNVLKKTIRIRLLRSDNREFPIDLKVYAIDNKVDSATGTISVRFRGANPEGKIIPGGYVKVLMSEIFPEPKIAVPMSAVLFEGDARAVYVVKDGKVAKRTVCLGETVGDLAFVTEGLKADETVVTAGVHKLRDGAAVNVQEK